MNPDPLSGLPLAPQWALTVGQAGKVGVYAAIALYLLAVIGFAVSNKRPPFGKIASWAFALGSLSLASAFGCLVTLFVKDQFQFEYVFARADVHTDLRYKVSGVWAGQQGSFFLWGIGSALFGVLALRGTGPYRRWFGATYAAFLGSVAAILAYETPFNLMKEVIENGKIHIPPTGNGMVPSLQNYWMAIHPPTIFLGFSSLTIPFAYAVAAILTGDLSGWVGRVRPWALAGMGILGLGICMGGFWAYETLGWGGFWMWDPVENASFVPWLFLATFVHAVMVQVSRGRWHGTTLWMGALPFLAFVYGTFLVRSGALDGKSVHAFAEMDRSALKILEGLMAAVVFGFGGLYWFRGRSLAMAADKPRDVSQPLHREGVYTGSTVLLGMLGAVLAFGMSWPLIMNLMHRSSASVEEPLYHKVVVWIFVPLMLLLAVGPFITWRGMGWRALTARVANVLSISIGTVGFMLMAMRSQSWGLSGLGNATVSMPFNFRISAIVWVSFLLVLCAFAAFGNLWRLAETLRRSRSSAGAFVSHFGLAVLMAGLIGSRGFEQEQRVFLRPDQPQTALGYALRYKGMEGTGLYDRNGKVVFDVSSPEGDKFEARPGLFYNRSQDGQDMGFTWPHIQRGLAHDVYMAVQPPLVFAWDGEGHWFKPDEEETVQGITVKYEKMTMSGTPGTKGAKFGAKLRVTVDGVTYDVTPHITVGEGPDMPLIGRELRVAMLGMDAKDRSVQLQMMFATPIYPITMFTKPLTGLVWFGTGILCLGGLMSAWSRRRPRAVNVEEDEPEATPSPAPKTNSQDAPLPAT